MRKTALLVSLVALAWLSVPVSTASARVTRTSDVVLAQVRLAPLQATAGIYRGSDLYVKVQGTPDNTQVVKMTLKGTFVHLYLSPHAGVFFIETGVSGAGRYLYALRYANRRLRPALPGTAGSALFGDRGVHLFHDGFRVQVSDAAHTGSVRYRIASLYHWKSNAYRRWKQYREPDYSSGTLPVPSALFKTAAGDRVLLRLQVASTEQQRETGLMNIANLDIDSGMIFVWPAPVLESFWMKDTNVALTVAFLSADGVIQETQDMTPLSLDLHTPKQPYSYAIEVKAGFFAAAAIRVGDKAQLHLGTLNPAAAQP